MCSCVRRHGGANLYRLDIVSASTFSGQRICILARIAIIVDHGKEPECFVSNFLLLALKTTKSRQHRRRRGRNSMRDRCAANANSGTRGTKGAEI